MSSQKVKRALISVSNKTGLIQFAKGLHELGIEIISTGGTCRLLNSEGIKAKEVSDITGFPEVMDGRVKTLHPKIHGGILGVRGVHDEVALQHDIPWIDLVVVNLYPFSEVINKAEFTFEEAIENIDIGGPTMIRSAAKNMAHVTVVVDPIDYDSILAELSEEQTTSKNMKQRLAQKAFAHTMSYDANIQNFLAQQFQLSEEKMHPNTLIQLSQPKKLRYGENPHQKAWVYQQADKQAGLGKAYQHQGKELSFNNYVDTHAALACVSEFEEPACAIVKHATPCGVACGEDMGDAFVKALHADATSAFGGIIALNRICDLKTAKLITSSFFEVVIAPEFSSEALAQFEHKKNLRLLALSEYSNQANWDYKFLDDVVLAQEKDKHSLKSDELKIVSKRKPTPAELENALFAWCVGKHVKSNAIVIAKDKQTLGIGPGQVSRIEATEMAISKAGEFALGASLASDAFFPFKDNIESIASSGIKTIIQPGGSIKDDEVIKACDEHDITMIFTGVRCFKH